MPKHDSTGRARSLCVEGRVFAIDQAQLVLVVADAKLIVSRALEVRFDAQQFSVPPLRRLQIGRPITDSSESSQCLCVAHKRFSSFSVTAETTVLIHLQAISVPV